MSLTAVYAKLRPVDNSKENLCGIQTREFNDGKNSEPGGAMLEPDTSKLTRLESLLATSITILLAIICFVYGIYIISKNNAATIDALPNMLSLSNSQISQVYASFDVPPYTALISISGVGLEILAFIFNIFITLLIEVMAYAHAVSLRWALYKEDRLNFNSPLRIFTNSKYSLPNRWYVNMVSLFCLGLSYAASSVLILPATPNYSSGKEDSQKSIISAASMIALAVGLGGQAAISLWCLLENQHTIQSWSSNPLNTTLAAIRGGRISHIKGRCMMSVHQKDVATGSYGSYPLAKQGSIYQAHGTAKYILAFLCVMIILPLVWVVSIVVVSRSLSLSDQYDEYTRLCWRMKFNWNAVEGSCYQNTVSLAMSPAENSPDTDEVNYSFAAQTVLVILFTFVIQGSQTIALHFVELFVNMSRDEAAWRQAYATISDDEINKFPSPGASLSRSPLFSALSSWEYITLFILKASLHWVMGQSLQPSIYYGYEVDNWYRFSLQFNMVYSRIIIYAIMAIILGGFAAYIAFRRYEGCQPATMGHIQTIANLIDNWEVNEARQLWWGDATSALRYDDGEYIRHAGTSNKKKDLRPICPDFIYAGHVQ